MKKLLVICIVSLFVFTQKVSAQLSCVSATEPSVAAMGSQTVCTGITVSLKVVSGNLNDAFDWYWYTGSCGGSLATNGVIAMFTLTTTTTFYVRGEGGCTSPGLCDTITVYVNPRPTVMASATTYTACFGQPITFTASGDADTYTWTGGIQNGVPFYPLSGFNYSVTGTYITTGCSSIAPITTTVYPLPQVIANASAQTICAGDSLTLTGSGSASTYTWTGGVQNGIPFTLNTGTSYTVTGIDTNGCSNTSTTIILVNSIPNVGAVVTPNATFCQGSSVTLSGSGATTYTWTGGVQNSTAFTPIVSGTYTVIGASSGCTNTATASFTVLNAPNVVATASVNPVCLGNETRLLGGGAQTYYWSNSLPNDLPFAPTTTQTYYVTGIDSNNCQNTASITVVVNPKPIVDFSILPSSICVNNGSIQLSAIPSGGIFSGINVTGNSFNPSSLSTGSVVLTYTYVDNTTLCSNQDTALVLIDACAGIENYSIHNTRVSLFPNPSNGDFTLKLDNELIDYGVLFSVYNQQGAKVYDEVLTKDITIITTDLNNGLYYYQITIDKVVLTRDKLIIRK